MKKYRFLVMILISFMCFCCGINEIKADSLPNCDLNFYNMKVTANEAGTDLTCAANNLCAKYCPEGSPLCFDTGLPGWGDGSRTAAASMIVSEENTVKSYGFTIYEEYADSNNKKQYRAVCNYSQNLSDAAAGSNLLVKLDIGANEKDSSGGYKYGHIFSVHFSGTYANASGKIIKYSSDNITLKRSGQYYSTNRTAKTTTKKGQTTTALDITSSTNNKNNGTGVAGTAVGKPKSIQYVTDENGNIRFQKNKDSCTTAKSFVSEYWSYVMIFAPILLIVLISIDFFKAMASNDADAIKKSVNNTVKRVIAAVVLLALPALLSMIFDLFGIEEVCI